MRKSLKVIGLSMMMVFLFSVAGFAANDNESAHLKKKPITVKKLVGKIKIDGKSKDKAWKSAKNVAKGIDTLIYTSSKARTKKFPADAAKVTTLKYLWDSKGVYAFITVSDKTPSTTAFEVTANDAVEWHIDAKNCKRASYNGKCDGQYRLSRSGVISSFGYINRSGFKSNSKAVNGKTSYSQEIKIRVDWHGVKSLSKGKKVGWDIQVNDGINNTRTYQLVWNSLDNAWTNPSTMGTLVMGK